LNKSNSNVSLKQDCAQSKAEHPQMCVFTAFCSRNLDLDMTILT